MTNLFDDNSRTAVVGAVSSFIYERGWATTPGTLLRKQNTRKLTRITLCIVYADDIGDDFSATLEDDSIMEMDVSETDECFVVETSSTNSDSGQLDWL